MRQRQCYFCSGCDEDGDAGCDEDFDNWQLGAAEEAEGVGFYFTFNSFY